jgi:prepilin-type processing-associated H-X9-DG protein
MRREQTASCGVRPFSELEITMRLLTRLFVLTLLTGLAFADDKAGSAATPAKPEIVVREIRYDGQLSDVEARFTVNVDLDVTGPGEAVAPLFEGPIAVSMTALPRNLRLVREGNRFQLLATREGHYRFKLDLVAHITRREPWNQVSFTGPETAIGSVSAQAHGAALDLELLTGTQQETETKDGITRVRGFLGSERTVSVRWQSKAAEVTRRALVTCDTHASVQVTPTVVKYATTFQYEILQGSVGRLSISLPASQALTKLQGEGVRDWQVKPDGGQQTLTVELIKPAEKSYTLTLFSEQAEEGASGRVQVTPPQSQDVDRESGSLAISAEDVLVETESATGLRQVNAMSGALTAYQFYSRPFTLALRVRHIEPVVSTSDRVTVRLEEARLLVTHALTLNVENAGVYVVELVPPGGFVVSDLHSDGVEDWKVADGKLTVNFNSRVLGNRRLDVQLEPALKTVPDKIEVGPLRVVGAAKETAQIGAAEAPGIQLKTEMEATVGVREVPIGALPSRTDETLAYNAEQPDWRLVLAAERLAPRITADVFNLITIGDGLLGGSATIRFAIINQGVQEFRLKVPALWKNVEFTGPSIRRKELQGDTWMIALQEKAWGGYTLVVTYDSQFDPHKATLPIGGIHPAGVERETGSIAITSAANLQLTAQPSGDGIRRVDEVELAANDQALITRPVLMAYKYQGTTYGLAVDVTRFEESPVLDAAADRTQLTTVLTDAGQMLTEASFMVKNNDRQFQSFTLPEGSDFWSCYVGADPVKPEKNGNKLLVPLPRRANRDEAFAVDIVYAQKIGSLKTVTPRSIALSAPETDMQTTYAEWELYVPPTHHLAGFGGNMIVARGTTYGMRDGWLAFLRFYDAMYQQAKGFSILFILVAGFAALVIMSIRRGWRGVVATLAVVGVLILLAAMMLPALSSSREKARTANSMSNLKQVGLGLATFADQHEGKLPATIDELVPNLITSDHVLLDPQSGEKYVYVGAGRTWQDGGGNSVIAYSPADMNGRNVLFSDGHVQWMTSGQFGDALNGTPVASQEGDGKMAFFDASGLARRKGESLGMVAPNQPASPPPPAAVALPHRDSGGNVLMNNGHVQWQDLPANAPGSETPVGAVGSYRAIGAVAPVTISGVPSTPVSTGPSATVAGIRPIRIDIPRTGQRFVFTKVLNVGKEPLAIRAVAMDQRMFNTTRSLAQMIAFIAGLGLLWWQFRQAKPNSLLATLGSALALGSVVNFLLATRLLGVALILGAPLLGLGVLIALVRVFWKRKPKTGSGENGVGAVSPTTPPVIATIVLLLFAASVTNAAPDNTVSILAANYVGTVKSADGPSAGRVAQFDATFELESTEPNQSLRLFGPDVAVQEFTGPKGGGWSYLGDGSTDARLVRDGQDVRVTLPKKGRSILHIKFLVKLTGDVAKRQIVFGIPSALTSRVTVTLDDSEAVVEAPMAVSFKSTANGTQTLVEAVFGASDHVELAWTPRMKRAEEMAATVFCQNASRVTFGGGAVNVRSVLDYQITQGELRQLRVALPVGQRLMRVEGKGIRTWKLDGQTLTVDLVKGVSETGPQIQGARRGTSSEENLVANEEAAKESQGNTGGLKIVKATWGGKDTWVDVTAKVTDLVAKGESSIDANTQVLGDPMPGHTKILRVVYTLNGKRQIELIGEGDSFKVPTVKPETSPGNVEPKNANPTGGDGSEATSTYRLIVETEMIQESPSVKVQTPHAVDVKRETGLIALKTGEEFGLTVETQDELQKVDVEDFARAMKNIDAATVSTAYRFLKPEFGLTVKVEPVQPQIDALVRNAVRVGTEQIALRTTIAYMIKRGGVFSLRLALPLDYRVERVAGDDVSQWVEKAPVNGGEPRLLEVTLKERTIGEYTLAVDLVRTLPQLPPSIEVVGVRPLDTQKLSGFVLVSSEEGVQLKSESFDGLTEIPPDQIVWRDALPVEGMASAALASPAPSSGGTVLAFKFIPGGSAGMESGWKLTLTTEKIESWVRAEIVNTVSLTETLISGKSLVRYEIQNAPTKEFRLRVPTAFQNVEITGPDIRRKDKDDRSGEWRVELQNKVRGYYTLTVTWEEPWNGKDKSFELTGVEAAGVERETGTLAILAPSRLKVDPQSVTPDLLKVDERDRPDWAGSTSEPAVLAYRYLRPGYKLTLAAQQFQEAEVLQALADSMRLTTVISEDGQMMTDMALAIRNNGRQYLEVSLPEDAVVWSAFVAGQPVRPGQRDGKLLLPMERSGGDATVPVELTYVGVGRFPRRSGSVRMMSPALDVPLKNARWELYLPPDYQYGDFHGTMKQEIHSAEASVAKAVASFGATEYERAEKDKRVAADAEAVSSLSNARSQLAGGKVSDAFQFYNRAKQAVALNDLRGNEDLKKLEGDLRREQGRSLLQAQQSFVAGNSHGQQETSEMQYRTLGGGVPMEQMQLEEQAAEQQVTKVQQAQEVTVAKTLSLHVNLPKRGVHYSFSQVLQTEVGKPMSVQFSAVNDRAMSWPSRIATSVGLFAILWLVVARTLRWKGTLSSG